MRTKATACVVVASVAVAAIAFTGNAQQRGAKTDEPKSAAPAGDEKRDADVAAIQKTAEEFTAAFNKGDAKAIAEMWTDMGESHEANGEVLVGPAEIEKAYAAHFKDSPKGTIEVDIRSIRFPSRNTAIEEGLLRFTPDGPGLPTSSMYTVSHVREDGVWKVAYSREWGVGQDRLGDLAFLIGKWEGGPKGQSMAVSFEKAGDGPFILGKFIRTIDGKLAATGTMKIGLDGQRGQIRSWHFDNDGGHGQCLWLRDGINWVLDAIGEQADGAEMAAVNILSRLSNDELTWRSIDRVVGGQPLPDTVPVKLTRIKERK
jgi:uncharacterized protein (TIGR02246 family)